MTEYVFLWFENWQVFTEQIILLIAFGSTVYSIWKNTDTNKTKLLHEMNCEERSLSIRLFEIARDINNGKSKKREDTEEKKKLEMEQKVIISQYLNFLEHLSLLINSRKISSRLAKRYWKRIIGQANDNYSKEIFPTYKEFIKLHQKWF